MKMNGHCEEERRANPMKETLILMMRLPQRSELSHLFTSPNNRFAIIAHPSLRQGGKTPRNNLKPQTHS